MRDDILAERRRRDTMDAQARQRWRSWSPWAVWLYGLPAAALIGGFLHHSGFGPFQSLAETLEKEAELDQQIESLELQNENLKRENEALMPGRFGIEKRVREQLGWSLPGEIVIHLPDKR